MTTISYLSPGEFTLHIIPYQHALYFSASPCRHLYSRYLNWFVMLSVISADSCANPSLKLLSACLCILLSLVAKSSDAFQVSIFLFFFPYKFAWCFSAPADVAWCVGVSMMKNQKKRRHLFYLSFFLLTSFIRELILPFLYFRTKGDFRRYARR